MNEEETGELLREIARDVVAEIAPEELPIFPAISSAYLANPRHALKPERSIGSLLGFGAEAYSALLTPAVMYVMSEVLKILADSAKKAVTDGLAKEETSLLTAMFKRFRQTGQPAVAPVLVEAQLAEIRRKVASVGRELHLPQKKVDILVKAVAAQLMPRE